jgi:P-type Mg2+ transporter
MFLHKLKFLKKLKRKNIDLQNSFSYWNIPSDEVLKKLNSTINGLSDNEVKKRLKIYGFNYFKDPQKTHDVYLLLYQFKSPLILLFIFTALLSFFLKETLNSIIILIIILISCLLSFWQERKAVHIIQKLLALVKTKCKVIRNDKIVSIYKEKLVPGDIVTLSAGDIIAADMLILESKDLFVDESTLTGEAFGVEKKEGVLHLNTPVNKRTNTLYMGSHIISGFAKAAIVNTAKKTEFGKLIEQIKKKPSITNFEKSIQTFSLFLMIVTVLLVGIIFIVNIFYHRSILTSLLFALALAIGLSPQLLPAIISINLAHGANRMSKKNVIIKKTSSIENFGSINILCCDKTGTLTEGKIKVQSTYTINKNATQKVALFAYLNSKLQTGYLNPLDKAILSHYKFEIFSYKKINELPYDFSRKILTIVTKHENKKLVITKGSVSSILKVSSYVEITDNNKVNIKDYQQEIENEYKKLSSEGFRVIGLSYKLFDEKESEKSLEKDMIFLGFIIFFDPIKKDVKTTIDSMQKFKIDLKIITGDSRFSAQYVANELNLNLKMVTGSQLKNLDDKKYLQTIKNSNVFVEIEPTQKENIILALKNQNFVVGYLGDGINDVSALHSADIGISVNSGADAAKEASDIVLLDKSLHSILEGIKEGRKTFFNTMKYIFMASSANFGNMFSVAGASLFLKFLPLLPEQILLTNLLTDIPEMTISSDFVDAEIIKSPVKLNISFIAKFMLIFGPISSIFDFATFLSLTYIFNANIPQFRTGWFLESVISAAFIIFVVRTKKPFYKSRPSFPLMISIISIIIVTLLIPYTPLAEIFNFVKLPFLFYLLIVIILFFYMLFAEIAKKIFYSKFSIQ